MKKSVFLTAILALASISAVYSKSYDLNISRPTQAGSLQLKAGDYDLKVDGDKAIFTDVNTSKKYTVTVKVENAAKKFSTTRIDATSSGASDVLKDIQLGGTTTQIDF